MTRPAVIEPPATLGVIGGGQLGRMFINAAHAMGYKTVVLTAHSDEPAAQVANDAIVGEPDDLNALSALAMRADAITYEFENISAAGLRWLARHAIVRPGWRSVWVAQHRIREKTFLTRLGVPVAPWMAIRTVSDLEALARAWDGARILKTAELGYDGRGQQRVERPEDLPAAWEAIGRTPCVAEGVVAFVHEVSCIVARGVDGACAAYPIFWNQHRNHILDGTVCPAPAGPVVGSEARRLAMAVAEALGTVGLLTVEFFVTAEGGLVINELAPRPHNSGHLTIEAAATSQFAQQVRALCGLPLGSTELIRPAAMVNLLGDLWENGEPSWVRALDCDPDVNLHLYGKPTARAGRKMGHLTVLDHDPQTALARARAARAALVEASHAGPGRA